MSSVYDEKEYSRSSGGVGDEGEGGEESCVHFHDVGWVGGFLGLLEIF